MSTLCRLLKNAHLSRASQDCPARSPSLGLARSCSLSVATAPLILPRAEHGAGMSRRQTVGNGFKPFPTMTQPMIKSLTGRSDFNNRIYQKARFGYSPHEPFPSPHWGEGGVRGKKSCKGKMRRSLRQRVLWNTLRLEKNGRCESRRLLKQKGLGKKMDIERMFPRVPFSQE
jgi:hypothetical protein